MRKRTTRQSAFTKPRTNPGGSRSSASNTPPAFPSWKLYRRISDIPLDRFITCFCYDDLSALVIQGDPPLEELQTTWAPIREDFEDGMKSSLQMEMQDLVVDINLYTTRYNCIKTICDLLSYFPVKTLVDELEPTLTEMLGFQILLDPADKRGFEDGLQAAMGHASRYLTEAMALSAQLPKDDAAKKSPARLGPEYFDAVIVNLSRYNRYKISKRDTTASEFIALVKDMNRGLDAARQTNEN